MSILQIYANHIKENVLRLYNENKETIKDLKPQVTKVQNESVDLERQQNQTKYTINNMLLQWNSKSQAFDATKENLAKAKVDITQLETNITNTVGILDQLQTNFSGNFMDFSGTLNGVNGSLQELKSAQIDFNANIQENVNKNTQDIFAIKGTIEGTTGISDNRYNETQIKVQKLQTSVEELKTSGSQAKILALEQTIENYKNQQKKMEDIFNATITNWTESQNQNGELKVQVAELKSKFEQLENRLHHLTFKPVGGENLNHATYDYYDYPDYEHSGKD